MHKNTIILVLAMLLVFVYFWIQSDFTVNCLDTIGTASITTLQSEAPETLKQPERKSFATTKQYKCAALKYKTYQRWDTD